MENLYDSVANEYDSLPNDYNNVPNEQDSKENIYESVTNNFYTTTLDSDKEDSNNSREKTDYIEHYQEYEEVASDPEPAKHLYEFEKDESSSSSGSEGEVPQSPKPISTMADIVDDGNSQEKENEIQTINSEGEKTEKVIFLFIKAGSDRECIGCCPFSQRLFMMLWLKGVVFNVTTVDKATKPKQLGDIAPGTNPPFLIFNGEELTDFQKCEDYIEAELYPPRYPKLACKHPQSNTVGNDIFAKFSAFIKFTGNKNDPKRKMLETKLNDALRKFDKYLNEPLDDEIDADDDSNEPQVSKRKFIDGDNMTIADCNMLPKLNMIRVAGKSQLNYEIPQEFTGIARYLEAADQTEEFVQTCPDPDEIVWTYGGRKPKPKKQQ